LLCPNGLVGKAVAKQNFDALPANNFVLQLPLQTLSGPQRQTRPDGLTGTGLQRHLAGNAPIRVRVRLFRDFFSDDERTLQVRHHEPRLQTPGRHLPEGC